MKTKKLLLLLLAALVCLGAFGNIPCLAAADQQDVYYFNDPSENLKLTHAENGLRMVWANPAATDKQASFTQTQNAEGVTEIAFDLDVAQNTGTTIQIGFDNRFQNRLVYTLSPAESAVGRRTVEIPIHSFTGNYTGPTDKGDDILNFFVSLSGKSAQWDATLTRFTVRTVHQNDLRLFDAAVKPNPFPPSFLYPGSQKPFLAGERRPRVFGAENALVLGRADWRSRILALADQFLGAFGLDLNYSATPGNQEVVRFYNARGIKTIFEGEKAFKEYTPYLAYQNDYLVNSEGLPGNVPGHSLFPYHGEDTTYPEVVKATEEKIDEAAREGFSEFLLIDYIWPWNGRWGYGEHTVAAFRQDLGTTDSGIFLSDGAGHYARQNFWDYLRLFTDVPFAPTELGLSSWNGYQPATEKAASNGSLAQKKSLFLFHALWHYEYLKYAQTLGDHAVSQGIGFYPSVNAEDPFNGTDVYVMGLLRGVRKIGYEYFGNPWATTGWYHTMRWYAGNMQEQGKDLSLIGEINGGGHGPTRYAWDVAYAFYYDATSSGKPIDYNVQYMEAPWSDTPKSDAYQFPRYAHWYAGALGFLQSHGERAALPPAKRAVLVASRGVLEYQPGFNSFAQTGNVAALLDQLHIPFDAAGKEQFAKFAASATTLVYCPAESSPMHFQTVKRWLAQGKGKTLITHSFVPFSFSNGTISLNPGLTTDLTWAGKANWNEFQKTPILSANKDLTLGLSRIESNVPVSLTASGQVLTAQRDVYQLVPSPSSRTVLASTEGVPLISRITRGANTMLYLHVRPLLADGTSETDFDRELLRRAMMLAGVAPEAQAPPQTAVHLYDVSGGRSAVLWDTATLAQEDPKNYYARLPLDHPVRVTVNVKPNAPCIIYDFYGDRTTPVKSDAAGGLSLSMTTSAEIFYYGLRDNAAFAQTLRQVKLTRSMLATVEPESVPPDAVPFQTAVNHAPDSAQFLVFSGGMDPVNKGLTDGTKITFSYREAGDTRWKTLGKRNFQEAYDDNQTLYALPLNGTQPQALLAVVSMNGNPAFDATIVHKLAIVRKDGTVIKTLGSPQERGLLRGSQYDTNAAQMQNSGAMFNYNAPDKTWVFHPAYNGVTAPVYGIFPLIP